MREFFSDKAALKNDHTETSRNAWLRFVPDVDFSQFTAVEFTLFSYISLVIRCVNLSLLHRLEFLEKWEIVTKRRAEACEEAVVRWLCEGPAGAAVHLHEMTSMVSGHGSFFYTQ